MTVVGITGASGALGRAITDYVLRSHPAEQLSCSAAHQMTLWSPSARPDSPAGGLRWPYHV
jgi:hypothetical protein